ncbi:FtsK/SpoIIIE domain-containing protein [Roseimaritima ulvae]|uniref:FtsK-like domain-containing protein n=1 Tax=Roseimaritima ulvae TaxID=980254 RepID=A0A5B9QKC0_9BACT|nr:FtsK/SpoIIIE domain-containing protein [Roseimaritima ulvae]QEG39508.1 FtsK-like domain-containing protein [Roseimaritima ulvae]
MTNTRPAPVGLLSPRRQQTLLQAMQHRCQNAQQQREQLQTRLQQAGKLLEQQLQSQRQQTLDRCRADRQTLLQAWDQADEQKVSHYENETLRLRQELNRLASKFRQARKEEHAVVFRKVQARCAAVQKQYETRKDQPAEQRQKEESQLATALAAVQTTMEEVHEVSARRLNGLPDVAPQPKEDWEASQESVSEAIETIELANRQIRETLRELYSGTPSKLVDTFWILPSWAAIFVVVWSIGALFLAQDNLLIALLAGLGVALVLFLSVLGILQIPLRRQTRAIYPRAEHLLAMAHRAVHRGKTIAAAKAKDFSADLLKTRDFHLQAAERWKREHLESIDQTIAAKEQAMRKGLEQKLAELEETFSKEISATDAQMHDKAEALAEAIRTTLANVDASAAARRQEQQQQDAIAIAEQEARFMTAIERGLRRFGQADQHVHQRFPAWQRDPECSSHPTLDYLPVGEFAIRQTLTQTLGEHAQSLDEHLQTANEGAPPKQTLPDALPLVLHRRLHAGIVIDCPSPLIETAVSLLQGMLWRALTGVTPGRCKLTLLDPLGRGQHFAGLIALADFDPALVGHRVWTSPAQIEARLTEMTQHNEDVLQSCLRDQYATIEDYNRVAGSLAEPYRVLAAVGLPAGVTQESASHLRALVDSARRCGNFLLLVNDPNQPWPAEMPDLNDPRLLRLKVQDDGSLVASDAFFEDLLLQPVTPPPAAIRTQWTEAIGTAALAAARIEIPLAQIFPESLAGQADSSSGLSIPIGSQGANRALSLALGEGVRQHVLIAGKTGSGKSTLLHTIITAGAKLYTPDELQFYLLDFKKGVEFQVYAEHPLPHARVIGIESEREFGRSVLQRLDAELQTRGEMFREAGVQEIGDYRRQTNHTLPRILLVVDEFQELFVRDDRIAGDCAMVLDRLVRQGRSFGIHIVLSSQSLAGAYSLPRATLGQMAVRIALQSSESDAALILGDDNPAARLINRPGEAIYNDASGLIEGNQPFQVAWLSASEQREILQQVAQRDAASVQSLDPPVVFAGNRPAVWTAALAEAALKEKPESGDLIRGLLGESVEIGPPTTLTLRPGSGRNVLTVAPPETTLPLVASLLSTLTVDGQRQHGQAPEIRVLDGARSVQEGLVPLADWLAASGVEVQPVKPRDCEAEILRLKETVDARLAADDGEQAPQRPIIVVISPLERFRELRQTDSYSFSLDDSGGGAPAALQALLRDGPQVSVHTILCCQSAETLTRWLPRSVHHDLELRLLGRMSGTDSANLIDTPEASDLTAATMLMYDDAEGRLTKFRICDQPAAADVAAWIQPRHDESA